ncbi:MAG: hypothetical protein ACI828_000286 [Flavobacteriales bacterium]|jgi:hypothetical protein
MKTFEIPFLIGALVALIIVFTLPPSLETGDLRFVSMNGQLQDRFALEMMTNIPAHTIIRFTDSEWNGNRFGLDEHDMAWNSGKQNIPAGITVHFTQLNSQAKVSHGSVRNGLHISQESDAIFAYLGSSRMPTRFLAVVGTDENAFGTLVNTGLQKNEILLVTGSK